ncbi:MAG: ABC transporter ATP-binding protein [Syntrophomonadaceae bacterium]|jgi:putative ABC transport system ATP-binding protein|nr:ABC transporter ATP-binding protein [Syntrophomonadaceae bacterium]
MEHIIEMKGISKIYKTGDEDTVALQDIDLTVTRGEFLAIMGPSGSGKSTLMHIMGLLDGPTVGQYFLEGRDVSRLNDSSLARLRNQKIGFVFQQFNLLPRTTVLGNVLLPTIYGRLKNSRSRALQVIEEVGLSDRVNHTSNQLSGGQMQRVAIARALVMNPAIILADEPTGNLDSKRSLEIIDIFRKINSRGSTVIIITHEEHIARNANRTIRLLDGKIISNTERIA